MIKMVASELYASVAKSSSMILELKLWKFFKNWEYILKRYLRVHTGMVYPIYQPLRSGRIWHKVNF